jgi:hypothetical protein
MPGDELVPRVPMANTVNDTMAFRVADIELNRWMLAEAEQHLGVEARPLDGDRTRLIARLKDLYAWRTSPGNALLSLILFELGGFPMTRKLLLGVKRRAEELANAADQAGR